MASAELRNSIKISNLTSRIEWAEACDSSVQTRPSTSTVEESEMHRKFIKCRKKRSERGLSLTELVVVVAIVLVIAAIAVPNAVTAWYSAQLRASAAELSDYMQQARVLATRKNATYKLQYQTVSGLQQVYINDASGTVIGTPINLPRQFSMASGAPTGSPQPTAYTLSTDTTSGTPCDNTCTLAFSSRGLPCKYDSTTTPATCTTPAATYFVYYLINGRPNGWAAVLVTKAGRTKAMVWNGTSWN
jgi:prepilin-type N-terminal cleavage/methylation domain-containing protein